MHTCTNERLFPALTTSDNMSECTLISLQMDIDAVMLVVEFQLPKLTQLW